MPRPVPVMGWGASYCVEAVVVKGTFVEGGSNAVVGANEFALKLRKMDLDLYKQLAKSNRDIARFVRDRARAKAGSTRQSARSATAVAGSGSARFAALSLKERAKPRNFVYGTEYGSIHYGQFRDWKGNQWTPLYWGTSGGPGYFFYPSINESRDEVMDMYLDAVARAAHSAGISTNFGGPVGRVGALDIAGL